MESPHAIIILVLLAGLFILIALTIQICACIRVYRRVRREKARLREIQMAAAETPPPYALVVLDRNFQRPLPTHSPPRDLCCVLKSLAETRNQEDASSNSFCALCNSRGIQQLPARLHGDFKRSRSLCKIEEECEPPPPTYQQAIRYSISEKGQS